MAARCLACGELLAPSERVVTSSFIGSVRADGAVDLMEHGEGFVHVAHLIDLFRQDERDQIIRQGRYAR